jgi:hypothetical protein
MTDDTLTIGQVADAAGLKASAIRFYEGRYASSRVDWRWSTRSPHDRVVRDPSRTIRFRDRGFLFRTVQGGRHTFEAESPRH